MDRVSEIEAGSEAASDVFRTEASRVASVQTVPIPDYLCETYSWAYLNPGSMRVLDSPFVVEAILWGNYKRLAGAALEEFAPGQIVLQPACAYGTLSPRLATHLGDHGRLVIADVAQVQLDHCAPKVAMHSNVSTLLRDAASHDIAAFDAVCCFFLLHEVPSAHRRRVMASLLRAVRPGGRLVFVDYHRPHAWHPLRPLMSLIFDRLEPFAKDLWHSEIRDFADEEGFHWSKTTYFGGLYQKVVAVAP